MGSALTRFKLPAVLVILLAFSFLFGGFVPVEVKSFFYATSLTLKAILFAVLPFIIFSFLYFVAPKWCNYLCAASAWLGLSFKLYCYFNR